MNEFQIHFKKPKFLRKLFVRLGLARSVKCCPVSLRAWVGSQNPLKKPGMVVHGYNPSAGRRRERGDPRGSLAILAHLAHSRLLETVSLWEKMNGPWRATPKVAHHSLYTHTHVYTCTHKHVHTVTYTQSLTTHYPLPTFLNLGPNKLI